MKQQKTEGSTLMLKDIDVNLQWTEQERDLLLKKCYLALMQWEVQTLQHLNNEEMLKNDSSDSEDDNNSFIMR